MSIDVPHYNTMTIEQLTMMFLNGNINLSPGFQRNSVWGERDRQKLMGSIAKGHPIPCLFLYKRHDNGKNVYDVIDGKQRLESIFMYMGVGAFRKSTFSAPLPLDLDAVRPEQLSWKDICKKHQETQAKFTSYKIQVVEVSGDFESIVDLFVCINSTGKSLTAQERRNAKFFKSPILKEAERLAKRYESVLLDNDILSRQQINRMKSIEFFAELLLTIGSGDIIDKKPALDRAIKNEAFKANVLRRISQEFTQTLNSVKKMFPNIRETRFRRMTDYYTLFVLVWKMQREKLILTDKDRNIQAFDLLKRLSTGVDELSERLKVAKPSGSSNDVYRDYLLTVRADTDSKATRQRRESIMRELLWSLFERKDINRLFSPVQKRILWNSDIDHKCTSCGSALTWNTMTMDHKKAHSKGGKTILENAQLMCLACNSKKNAR